MGIKEDYLDLRKVFLKFKRESHFETYTSADLFYVFDSDGKTALLTFIDQFFGDGVGIQCFNNKDGINYVHDVLSSQDEYSVTVGDCDSIVAVFKPKDALTLEDISFLKKMNQRRTKENNLIIYRFKKGYKYKIASNSDIKTISIYGVFLDSLIDNEEADILEAFNQDNCVVVSLNYEKREYSCLYRPLPYLEIAPKKQPMNQQFIDEYKDHTYTNEDCYLFTSYLPVSVKDSGIRPLLLYFYYNKSGNMELKYIISNPKDYKNIIYGILDEVFTKDGLPTKMIINNRDLYAILSKTLDGLSIENSFERDNLKAGEDVSGVISSMYQKTQDTEMEESEIISMFNFLIQAVGTLDQEEFIDTEDSNDLFVS